MRNTALLYIIMGAFMDINEAMAFINSYSRSGKRVTDLSRAQGLMQRLDSPEKKLRFVHIAGTNGKGSTLEYISRALINSGYRTGQFTSPYVLRYTDRIRINGEDIDEASLCSIAEQVKAAVDDEEYSQFEITMAVAFLWYVRENCDVVVLETGIGGLLDSTNVIPPPLLSVITSISLDHTAILGETVGEIAVQKAGIIKPGSAVILSADNADKDVIEVVMRTAQERGAEYIEPEQCRPAPDGGLYSPFVYNGMRIVPGMPGLHQYYNAMTAVTACVYLRKKGFDIPDETIKQAIETTQVRARAQYIDGEPPVILDGGHNPSGVGMLSLMLMYLGTRGKKIYTVMGMVDSKDYAECVKIIAPLSDRLFAVDGFTGNAVPAQNIVDIASFYTEASPSASLAEAVEAAKALARENDGLAVVCGSLYLASEYMGA